MILSPDQEKAAAEIVDWYQFGQSRVFCLDGLAGTGKSTLARTIVDRLPRLKPERTRHMAPTGKAAQVMRAKGLPDATTIHQAFYKPASDGDEKIKELTDSLLKEEDQGKKAKLRGEIIAQRKLSGGAAFRLEPSDEVKHAKLIVLDERSMLPQRILEDMLKESRAKILLLGDPGQLPPVMANAVQLKANFTLTEIHRQARDNPLLLVANEVRATGKLPFCDIRNEQGSITVTDKTDPQVWRDVDQIIVARNITRRKVNARMRQVLGREADQPPCIGDKVVVLRNDHDLGIFNGMTGTLADVSESSFDRFVGDLQCDTLANEVAETIPALDFAQAGFMEMCTQDSVDRELVLADYGWSLTCHKCQGSEWDSVGIICDRRIMDFSRWAYTAITRARKHVIVLMQ